MKRFHVHVSVEKLDDSIRFYSSLFGAAPTVVHPDYAKWMLEDPRVNFAISQRGRQPGVNHLGFQVERMYRTQSHARPTGSSGRGRAGTNGRGVLLCRLG